MESIIPLILFTYPGAAVEFVYSHLSRNMAFFRKPDEVFRVARDFFLSALVTVICLWITGAGTLEKLMEKMQQVRFLAGYLLLSVIAAVVVGLLWFAGSFLLFHIRNWCRKAMRKPMRGAHKTVWQDFFSDPDIQSENVIAAVFYQGKMIRAGLLHERSSDTRTDTGLVLTYSRTVEGDLKRKPHERVLVGAPIAHYLDLATGMEVALYDGNPLIDYLNQPTSVSAGEVEPEQASAESVG